MKFNKRWVGRKLLALVLVLGMVLGQAPLLQVGVAQAEGQKSLVITGTGLKKNVMINELDWLDFNNPNLVEGKFSSNNRNNFHKIWKIRGYSFFDLIKDNVKEDQDYKVEFIASDGFKRSWKLSELKSLYYYPDFTVEKGQIVEPMLGIYNIELFDHEGPPGVGVSWTDKALTSANLDKDGPRVYLGQAQGNASDINQMNFVRNLARIVIGEEWSATGATEVFLDVGSKVAYINGEPGEMDAPPFIENYRTFVPVRFVAEAFGAKADWKPEGVVTLTKGDMLVTMSIGSPGITVTDKGVVRTVPTDVPPRIVKERTYLPLRALGEIFGAQFDYGPKQGATKWVSFKL